MKNKTQREMASRVAAKALIGSSGTSLSAVLLNGASQARIAFDQIERIVERAVRLIDESEKKEHIYSEAGDMITNMRSLLSQANEGLSLLSYAAAKVDEKKLKNDFPASLRDEIDNAVKKDT